MKLENLKSQFQAPLFTSHQVERIFATEPKNQIATQLARMAEGGKLIRLKKGVYLLPNRPIDEHVIANHLYRPSYVSLESALHLQGIIPDIVANVTSISPITSKSFNTPRGTFSYSKIRTDLFFGFESIKDSNSDLYYQIAEPEKALLDWIYVRRHRSLSELRVDQSSLDQTKLREWALSFPKWVWEVLYE